MSSTIYDVAEKARVSVHTAMRALNGTTKGVRRDAQERAERIREAANALNYRPNDAAKALRTKRTGNVGFILSKQVRDGICNPYYGKILGGVEKVCTERGFGLYFGLESLENIKEFVYPKAVAGRNVDAVFLAGSKITPNVIQNFEELNLPCMCFSHCEINSEKIVLVHRQSTDCFKQIFRHASALGHRRIGVIETPCHNTSNRHEELKRWLDEHDMEYMPLEAEFEQLLSAQSIARFLLELPKAQRPSLITGSPEVLITVLNELANHGISCPEEISAIAYGTSCLTDFHHPRLTAVDLDVEQFGANAARAMFSHLLDQTPLAHLHLAPQGEIILGASVLDLRKQA
jgi:LacI family transcriptional regulator